MEKNKEKYEDFRKEWDVSEEGSATHNTGLTIHFVSKMGKRYNLVYKNYIPWRRSLYKSGLDEKQIDKRANELTQQFYEICEKEIIDKFIVTWEKVSKPDPNLINKLNKSQKKEL